MTPSTANQGMTFSVSDVKPGTRPFEEVSYRDAVEHLLDAKVEACTQLSGTLVAADFHPFVAAVHGAFCGHRPLKISPDMIWLLLCQGFANHINANSKELRSRFVAFKNKETIRVRRDDFLKGSPENPWPETFVTFTDKIREYIGDRYDLFVTDFSTTTSNETAAFQVTLMDAVKCYFDYELYTLCGIPSITLEGTVDDWRKIRTKAEELAEFDLHWWIPKILPVLDHFVAAADGNATTKFWRSIYKFNDESGGPKLSGWIINFFPYLRHGTSYRRNDCLRDVQKLNSRDGQTLKHADLPFGLSVAPFKWFYYFNVFEMEFYAGFVGVRQDRESLALRPEIGWAIRDTKAESNVRERRLQEERDDTIRLHRFLAVKKIAEDVTKAGGTLEVCIDGEQQTIDSIDAIPEGEFKILVVDLTDCRTVDRTFLYRIFCHSGWDSLRELHLSGTATSKFGVADIAANSDLAQLRVLSLNATKVNDGAVESLRRMQKLEQLHVKETSLSGDAVGVLRESMPKCRILHD